MMHNLFLKIKLLLSKIKYFYSKFNDICTFKQIKHQKIQVDLVELMGNKNYCQDK